MKRIISAVLACTHLNLDSGCPCCLAKKSVLTMSQSSEKQNDKKKIKKANSQDQD